MKVLASSLAACAAVAVLQILVATPAVAGWISLAASGDGLVGYSVRDPQSYVGAMTSAVTACGHASCRSEFTVNSKCLAYTESRAGGYWYGEAYSPSVVGAVRAALQYCQSGAPAGTCQIIVAACNND